MLYGFVALKKHKFGYARRMYDATYPLGRNTRPRGRLRGRRVADRFHDLQVDEDLALRLELRQRPRVLLSEQARADESDADRARPFR